VGISIGLPVAAFLLAVIAFFHWSRHKKRPKDVPVVAPCAEKELANHRFSVAPNRYRPPSEIDGREVTRSMAELSPDSAVPTRPVSVRIVDSRPVSAINSPPNSAGLSTELASSPTVGSGRDYSDWSPRLSHMRWSTSTAAGVMMGVSEGYDGLPPLAELPG
jgi:hypothetical protein